MQTVIIGAGIGGLATALALAQRGHRVRILERGKEVGGRGRTQLSSGYAWNLGPHALYPRSESLLRQLGIRVRGSKPSAKAYLLVEDALQPFGISSLALTPLLRGARMAFFRWYLGALRGPVDALRGRRVDEWLEESLPSEDARQLAALLLRVTSYCADPRQDAATAALALRDGMKGVRYLDGGWQQLIGALVSALQRHGVVVEMHAAATRVLSEAGRVRGVGLADGTSVPADKVVLAVPPREAALLLGGSEQREIERVLEAAGPLRAACLDVALSSLPSLKTPAVFGLAQPFYLSVHSLTADGLCPPGGAVVHVARYLAPGAAGSREELEALLELAQPGWRNVLVDARYLPSMEVAGLTPVAAISGTLGRPAVRVKSVRGAFLVGDWVKSEGILTSAVLESALEAAAGVLEGERHATERVTSALAS